MPFWLHLVQEGRSPRDGEALRVKTGVIGGSAESSAGSGEGERQLPKEPAQKVFDLSGSRLAGAAGDSLAALGGSRHHGDRGSCLLGAQTA
jgi:hypothetical protein